MPNKKKKQHSRNTTSRVKGLPLRDATHPDAHSENFSFARDQRRDRIGQMSHDLQDRQQVITQINKLGGFDAFVAATLKLEGHITGLKESFDHAPERNNPEPPIHVDH